jgi:hypothetical protein
MEKRVTNKQAMEHIAAEMDKREEFKKMLHAYFEKYGTIPECYQREWDKLKDEPHWRQDAKIMAELKITARIMARNENERRAKRAGAPKVAEIKKEEPKKEEPKK